MSEEDLTTGTMISRPVKKIPEDPKEAAKVLQKVLTDHYKDIATLFAQCTDNDQFTKKQRDNMAL